MHWGPALRALRGFGVAIVLLGVVGAGLGLAQSPSLTCEPGYALAATPADAPDDAPGDDGLAYGNLTSEEREWFDASLDGTTRFVRESALPERLRGATVEYDGQAYRIQTVVHDCGRSVGPLWTRIGGAVLAVGLAVAVPAHLLLGRTDDEDRSVDWETNDDRFAGVDPDEADDRFADPTTDGTDGTDSERLDDPGDP